MRNKYLSEDFLTNLKGRLTACKFEVYILYIRKNVYEVFIIEGGNAVSLVPPMTSRLGYKLSSENTFVNFRGSSTDLLHDLSMKLFNDEFILEKKSL